MFESREVEDGTQVSPPNMPCTICTCNRGVITCKERPCNCTAWRRNNSGDRDVCCSNCDPQESCPHQELKNVVFKSGEKWIYRCQTCECLVRMEWLFSTCLNVNPIFFENVQFGETDCWKLECPTLNCDNPMPLAPGDCCPRCSDEPCGYGGNSTEVTNGAGEPCTYQGLAYASGRTFSDSSRACTTCTCKVSSSV